MLKNGYRDIPGMESWSWDALAAVIQTLAATPQAGAAAAHLLGTTMGRCSQTTQQTRRDLAVIFATAIDPSFPAREVPTMS